MLEKVQIISILGLSSFLNKFIFNIKIKNLYIEILTLPKYVRTLTSFFKKHHSLIADCFIDAVVIDNPTQAKRFSVTYSLLSLFHNTRYFIKIKILEITKLLSINYIHSGSNWYEREVWDMFGIVFIGNLDMRRLLTDYNFKGYPLRKDFPLSGFLEIFFSSLKDKLIYKMVKLSKKFTPNSTAIAGNTLGEDLGTLNYISKLCI